MKREENLSEKKKMDEIKVKMLFVFKDEKFLCILTIGDIQRAIINGDKETGICTMITELGLDSGDVCMKQVILRME